MEWKIERKLISLFVICMFVSASFVAIEAVAAENGVFVLNQSSNPYELIEGVTWFPETLDPAKCYDVASAELILNVYETLISFNGERSDLFIPLLAEEWGFGPPFPSSPSYTNYTVWFRIGVGVPFHTWSRSMTWGQYYLTTEDVEYSFERLLVHDYQGGPQLALYEPLLGVGGALGLEAAGFTIPEIGQLIDSAVQRNDLYVWFNIVDGNYQSITFLRMLAQPWCAVISKQWVNEFVNPWGYAAGIDMNEVAPGLQFEWDGFWGDYTGWADYWGWDESPLDLVDWTGVTCGTGPYILDYYDPLYGWSVVRYYDYWQGWPALGPSPPYPPYPSSGIRPSGYIERFTVQRLWNWQTIILNLLVGYIDLAPIPVEYAGQLHVNGNINGPTVEGIRLVSMLFPYAPYVIRCYMRTWVNGWFYSPLYTVPFHSRKFALVVGTGGRAMINDAKNVAYKLQRMGWNVRLLLGSAAWTDAVMAGLNWLANNAEPDDYALFYFSGHGGNILDQPPMDEIDDYDEVICTADGYITDDFFTEWVRPHIFPINGIWSRHLAMILDSCRSGGFIHVISEHYYGGQLLEARDGAIILTAAGGINGDSDLAYVSPFHDRSQFTYHLFVDDPYDDLESMFWHTWEKVLTCTLCPFWQIPLMNDLYEGNYTLSRGFTDNGYASAYGVYAYTMWKWNYIDADVDFDGKVSMSDIMAIVNSFGSRFGTPGWNFWCDIYALYGWRDSRISMDDIIAAVANFGERGIPWQPP